MLKKCLFLLVIGFLLYLFFFPSSCSFDKEYARAKVLKYLDAHSLPHEYLVFDPTYPEECSCSFMYEGYGEKIHFVVIDDFLKGPKLTFWDFNKQGE